MSDRMNNNLETQIAYVGGEADRIAAQSLREASLDASALGGHVEATYKTIHDNLTAAANHAVVVQSMEAKLRDRDYPLAPGDVPLFRDKATGARNAADAAFKAADTGIEVLKALLVVGAMPHVDDADYDRAVKEAEMLLAGNAGGALVAQMSKLAAGSDRRLAAVVAGTWGAARLKGNVDDINAIKMTALGAAVQHGSPSEKRHAEAFGRMTQNLGKHLAVARLRASERMRVN